MNLDKALNNPSNYAVKKLLNSKITTYQIKMHRKMILEEALAEKLPKRNSVSARQMETLKKIQKLKKDLKNASLKLASIKKSYKKTKQYHRELAAEIINLRMSI